MPANNTWQSHFHTGPDLEMILSPQGPSWVLMTDANAELVRVGLGEPLISYPVDQTAHHNPSSLFIQTELLYMLFPDLRPFHILVCLAHYDV